MSTIVVRGSTDNIMDDTERALDDGINTFRTIAKVVCVCVCVCLSVCLSVCMSMSVSLCVPSVYVYALMYACIHGLATYISS